MTRLLEATISEKPAVASRINARASAPLLPSSTTNRQPPSTPSAVARSSARRAKTANPSITISPEKASRPVVSPALIASPARNHWSAVRPVAATSTAPTTQPMTLAGGFHWTSTSSTAAAPRARARSGAMAIQEISGGVIILRPLPGRRPRPGRGPAPGNRSGPRCDRGPTRWTG